MRFTVLIANTRISQYCGAVLLLLFAILCFSVCWHYWKLKHAFKNIPSLRLDVRLLLNIITGQYPKNVPFSSILFQEAVKQCKRFEKEGFCLMWLFRPYLIVYNEESIKRFYNESAAVDKPFIYNVLKDGIGNGLVTSQGDRWKHHRKLLNPIFNTTLLKGKMDIFNQCSADLVEKLETIANEPFLGTLEFLKTVTFNVMAESVLGLKFSDHEFEEKIRNYQEIIERAEEVFFSRMVRPWLYWKFMLHLFPSGRKFLTVYREFHKFTKEVIEEIKEKLITPKIREEGFDSNVKYGKSLVHILLEQHLKNSTFTIEDMEDHVTTIMAAGHESTASALMCCLYVLGRHPEIQEKAFEEVRYLSETDVLYHQLCKLTYIDCIIKETLRLYPIVPVYGRTLSQDVQWKKWTLPKGTDILFFPYMLHRNPNVFPDPEKFDPERFSENAKIRTWMHIPFAEGPRSCVGKKIATMEMKVMLAHVLRRFEIRSLNEIEETDMKWEVILKTTKPMNMLFTPRQSQTDSE